MPARRVLPLLACLVAFVLSACGSSDDGGATKSKPTATASSTPAGGGTDADTGCRSTQPDRGKVPAPKKPTAKLDPSKVYVAHVKTSCGEFDITLAVKKAPKTSASFASLVKQHFYDGLTFHRIVAGFVIQGGDPEGNGSGGPGYSVHEAPPSNLTYTHGVVAMAKTGTEPAGTSGSQFFVVTAQDAQLPPDYALLGRVTKGLDVVDAIGAVPTNPDDSPVKPVLIESITVGTR